MTIPIRSPKTEVRTSLPPDDAATIAYCRVSTKGQATDDKESLPDQERACREFAAQRGRTLDFTWVDPGRSGRDEARLEALAAWCEAHPRRAGKGGMIVCLSASRWGRFVKSQDASGYYKHRLRMVGWEVDYALAPRTGNRTTDGVLAVLGDAKAADESVEIEYRARMGARRIAAAGGWGGRQPFALRRVAVSSTGKTRMLEPHQRAAGDPVRLIPGPPRAVRTVKRIFAEAARGDTMEEIAERLNAERVPGPWANYEKNWRKNAPRWSTWSLRPILTNPAYLGRRVFRPRHGQPGDPIVVENAWEAIIDIKTWGRVQLQFEGRKGTRGTPVVAYLLRGLLTCTACGSPMKGGGGTRYWTVDGKRYRKTKAQPGQKAVVSPDLVRDDGCTFYKCPSCSDPIFSINRPWLEAKVIAEVQRNARRAVRSGTLDKALDQVSAARRSGGLRRARPKASGTCGRCGRS